MKTYIFNTKESYLQMKQTWATYFNTEARKLERNEYGNKTPKLKVIHFILYAIARGQDPYKCIATCSGQTLLDIQWAIGLMEKYPDNWGKQYKEQLGLTDDEFIRLIECATDIFKHKKSIEQIKTNRIPLSENEMTKCLA